MIEIEITGIRKDNGDHYNPYEAIEAYRWIEHISGKTNITPRHTVADWLDRGLGGHKVLAYVNRVNPKAYCFVNQSATGTRFLQTHADTTTENNLLELPEC